MCGGYYYEPTFQCDSAEELELFLSTRGWKVRANTLRYLVKNYWKEITRLAHAIHAEEVRKSKFECFQDRVRNASSSEQINEHVNWWLAQK